MAEYRDARKTSFSAAELSRFRQLINKWVAGIANFECKNLGDILSVVEVWDAPIHRVIIDTQYDNRTLTHSFEKLKGRNFPSPTILREADINRWSLAKSPVEFTTQDTQRCVSGSQAIDTCHTCSGKGVALCVRCVGKGVVQKLETHRHVCYKCGGRGSWQEVTTKSETVQVKDSSGRYVNQWRTRTRDVVTTQRCSTCNGSGYTTESVMVTERCSVCSGSGKVTCPTCSGERKVLRFWSFRHKLFEKQYFDFCLPRVIPRSEALKMSKLLAGGTDWYLVEEKRVQGEDFRGSGLFERSIVGNTIERLSKYVEHFKDTKICFNRVETAYMPAKYVVYQVNDKKYTCLLLVEQWQLLTVVSPVSTRMNDLKAKVNTLCSRRLYGAAWGVLKKAAQFPQAGSREALLTSQLEQRMAITTRLGSNIGLFACLLFASPFILTIYEQGKLFAPWSHWIIEKFELSPALLALFTIIAIGVFGVKYHRQTPPAFAYKVASPLLRFVLGIVVGVVTFAYFSIVLWAAAYIGVLPIIVAVLQLIMLIIIAIAALIYNIFS